MIFQRFFISVLLLAPVFGAAAPDLPTFSEEKDSRVLLFEHSVLWPSRGMPHEVKAYFKQVEVLPTSTTKVSLVPSRAQRHLATFAQPKSHAAFLKTPYFYKVFDEMMLFIERFQKTKNLKTTFSVLFDRSQREDAIVTSFDFEKKNNKIVCNLVVNALTQTVDTELVNLVQSLICDDSLVARHWGKGLFATAALLAVIFKKELPLGIGKKFQSFYEQAEREVARVYPGIFGEWQPFVAGAKFAIKKDNSRFVIILVSKKDVHAFRAMNFAAIKEKIDGATKIVVMTEQIIPAGFDHYAAARFNKEIETNCLCFPLKTTVQFRSLTRGYSLLTNPFNFRLDDLLDPNYTVFFLSSRDKVINAGSSEGWALNEIFFYSYSLGRNRNHYPRTYISLTNENQYGTTHLSKGFLSDLSDFIHVSIEKEVRDFSQDETSVKEQKDIFGSCLVTNHRQKLVVYRNPENKLVLVADGASQVLENVDHLWIKIKEIAISLYSQRKEEDLFTVIFGELSENPDRPKAFDELEKTRRPEDGLLEQDIVLHSDEDFADLLRNDDRSIKVIGHDGAEKNIPEAEAQKLREVRLKLGEFVRRMKKTNDAEADHARKLLVEPNANGNSWEKVAHIISECMQLSVDEFKKKEGWFRRFFDLEKSREQDSLRSLRILFNQFTKEIKAAIPGSTVSYSEQRFCYNVRLEIGEDSFWIVIANPLGYVLNRKSKDGDNLSTRQITRAALVADFINTDLQCTEYGFSAPQMKLCLRKGAAKEGLMDDRFLIAIEKIESVPAVGGAGVGAAPAMFTVQQLCKIAEIMERAGSIAWDDTYLVSIPPVEGSDSIGSHRFMNLTARKGFFFQKHKCPALKPYMLLDRVPSELWSHEFAEFVYSRRVGARRIKLFSKIYPSELDDFLFDRIALLLDNPWKQLRKFGIPRETDSGKPALQIECFNRRLLCDYLVTLKACGLLDEDHANRIQDFWFNEDAINGESFLMASTRENICFIARKEKFVTISRGTRVHRIFGQEGEADDDAFWQELFDYERDVFTPAYEAALMAKEDSSADGVRAGAGAFVDHVSGQAAGGL